MGWGVLGNKNLKLNASKVIFVVDLEKEEHMNLRASKLIAITSSPQLMNIMEHAHFSHKL